MCMAEQAITKYVVYLATNLQLPMFTIVANVWHNMANVHVYVYIPDLLWCQMVEIMQLEIPEPVGQIHVSQILPRERERERRRKSEGCGGLTNRGLPTSPPR